MYYDKQSKEKQQHYKQLLQSIGRISNLFSESDAPLLNYRAHENIFARSFGLTNNARHDDSADAYDVTSGIGIGLKTWVGQNDQKIAEFGRLRPQFEHLTGLDLIKKISEFRNKRIQTTMNAHSLKAMYYHIVKRIPGGMEIYEADYSQIDIDKITIIEKRGNDNNIYFTDGWHTYHFSLSNNTLYRIFDDMILLDTFPVDIIDNPYDTVLGKLLTTPQEKVTSSLKQLCLRLYVVKNGVKVVEEHSGINQWNGVRKSYKTVNNIRTLTKQTPRDPNEIYIPYPAKDRKREDFFPARDESFDLQLPNGTWISAKVCQDNGKAIMSNPNKTLGKWLLRDVFMLKEGTLVTYEMLREFNIDCVVFTKLDDHKYSIDFGALGTYEKFYKLKDIEKIEEN